MVAQIDSLYVRTSIKKTVVRLLSYALFEGRPLTTKGQWINPFILGLFSMQKRLPQLKAVHQPVFIVGTGRSGTTVLGILLSMHKDVGFLNEPKALWHSIYSEEDLVGSYSRGRAKYRLTSDDASESIRLNAQKLFGAYLSSVFSSRVVDKYPELIFRISFVRELFPDAKFVFLVRNGWDTCQSIEGWSERLGVKVKEEQHDWWGVNDRKWDLLWQQVIEVDPTFRPIFEYKEELENPLDMAALEWITSMNEGLKQMQKYPDDFHLVRYEELVSSPRDCLTKILEFCELDSDNNFFQYASQRLKSSSNRNPFDMHPSIYPFFVETMEDLGYSLV